jgi:predicted AAA+ superfamily ATPase
LLAKLTRQFPVVVVAGLRQTGKSTLLRHEPSLTKGRDYLTLDDISVLALAKEDPERLLRSQGGGNLALDEVQRAPELFLSIKRQVDEARRPGKFILSGSANLLLLEQVADSLAGRAFYATLHPLNRRERFGATGTRPALLQFLDTIAGEKRNKNPNTPSGKAEAAWPETKLPRVTEAEVLRGGFPEVALREETDAGLWFDAFERTCLERDVRDLRRIEDLVGFHRLLRLAVLRTGGILNVTGLARDAQMREPTARRYLDLLETLMVLRRLPPWLGNRSSRLVKAPKLFFADSGLAARLAGCDDIGPTTGEPMRGPLFENFVLQNLLATVEPHVPGARFYFWNEQGRSEVDFVIELGAARVVAIEVKAHGRAQPDDAKHLKKFVAATPACAAGILAYSGEQVLALGERIWAVPLHRLLA